MSFSDLMSSGRGPGVIGMLLALVVLAGFGILFLFATDEGMMGGDQSIESVIAHQAKDIESYLSAIETGNKRLAAGPALTATARELASAKRQIAGCEESIVKLGQAVEEGKKDVAARLQAFEDYKNQYRTYVRNKAKGETMAVLETKTGIIYKNATIREVTPVGIQIRHDEGHKRIPFEELPDGMIDYYQFDAAQKDAALIAETATRTKHESEAAAANEAVNQAMAEQREKDEALKRQKIARDIEGKKAQIGTLKDDIRRLEADMDRAAAEAASARAAGRMHINKSSGISGNIRAKQTRISTLQSEISQLQANLQH